jgi:undecaprenyl diphosphate synthase
MTETLTAPTHIAVIMDGNGRWAKARGLPRIQGHQLGARTLHEIVEACNDLGVRFLTAYSFSTENWQRPKLEVDFLMTLIGRKADEERPGLIANNVRFRTIGRLHDLPNAARRSLERLTSDTSANSGLTLTLALSYGGRAEILDACRRAVAAGQSPPTEADFAALLYDPLLPDPDLLIRTGGDRRISNFLLWQLAYTELHFTDTLWPDFGPASLREAVRNYGLRQRRFGRVDEE